ncbi:MAG: Cyclic nucleotide-binding domain [Acidobacteria bacterium]|nr:Cyclic nucleotide-binding domain [Acidobacteriota bacterium]
MLKTIEKALLLQEVEVLRFASADHLMQLAEAGTEQAFARGDIILHEGDPSLTFYILLLGAVSEGKSGRILEKTAINLNSCLTGGMPSCDYICTEDCTVLSIAAADLLDLLAGEPELSLALLKYFATEIQQRVQAPG